ncbi:Leucine-rich alpha-2-glycoprotein [Holothuria leucospilota]|uniref:Leucine-rich alpha-2-glycoprotein n=1 Tax=Holothuria leucospilota TaxID=206669 RepID=A0A9Q1HL67_HOLLE|nr:Leucine-rich alpha-2-glycoprotein [Holothuria leucospilota]
MVSLELCNNRMESLSEEIFENNPALKYIRLSNNSFTELPVGLFQRNQNMETISLTRNQLEELPGDLFENTSELIHLELSRNRLKSLPVDLFKANTRLKDVILSYNILEDIPEDLFINNTQLRSIDFTENFVRRLPERLLLSQTNLRSFAICKNKFTSINKTAFNGFTDLIYLYIFSNNLVEISNKSFESGSLREVQLYKNKIKYLTADAFGKEGSRIDLYLHCYDLAEIPLLNLNLTATCITSGFIPKIKLTGMHKTMQANLIKDGFNCTTNDTQPMCSPCPPGTYGDGHNGCQNCPAGPFLNLGGFYQDDFGRLTCKSCPEGVFVNCSGGISKADCALCPEGTNLTRHAGHRACFCKINYARTNRFEGCSLCLERGLNCSQDFRSLQPGFYWNWSFQGANITEYSNFVFHLLNDSLLYDGLSGQYLHKIPKVHECPQKFNCENKDSFVAGRIQGNCKDGFRGWLCSKCQEGFYSVLDTCTPCPDKLWIVVEVVAILLFGFASYAFIYWQNKKEEVGKRTERSLVDTISSQMKIVLGFYQVVGELFESFHDISWVGPLEFVGKVIAFLKVNILRVVIRPHCYSEKLHINAKIQFIISLSFPIAIIFFLVCFYQVWRLYLKYRVRASIECLANYFGRLKYLCSVLKSG